MVHKTQERGMVTIADINKTTQECINNANKLFGVDLSKTSIVYNLRGKAAATAGWKNGFDGAYSFKLRYNKEAIVVDTVDFIKNTIPHEVAHLVCAALPHLGKNHDRGWKVICRRLGGHGERCHTLNLTPGRRTKRYVYTATCGTNIEVSSVRHGKIQRRGAVYILRATSGKVNRDCSYKLAA